MRPMLLFQVVLLSSLGAAYEHDVRSYLAMGDSYPAGDGAGQAEYGPGYNIKCGQFSEGYPVKIAERLGIPAGWLGSNTFLNKACGGATTESVRWHQVWSLKHKNFDLATIQIGGNEVDFFPVLNECIQQWHPLSSCDRELTRAKQLIKSTAFVERFDRMMSEAEYLKGRGWLPDTDLLVLGYARFFNEQTTQCNNVTFSLTNPANVLSQELRHDFNRLVIMLNDVIKASAEAHNATYVDIDEVFEGHRFCEEGITEPHPDWAGTWFFRETSRQVQDLVSEFISKEEGDASAVHLSSNSDREEPSIQITNPLKRFADLTRTFHPTVEGHHAIADKVLEKFGGLRAIGQA